MNPYKEDYNNSYKKENEAPEKKDLKLRLIQDTLLFTRMSLLYLYELRAEREGLRDDLRDFVGNVTMSLRRFDQRFCTCMSQDYINLLKEDKVWDIMDICCRLLNTDQKVIEDLLNLIKSIKK